MLQPGPAPGRETPGATPPPPASTAAPAPTPSAPPPGGGLGSWVMMAPILIMVVMLFFLSRADKKKRQQLESTLKKGDTVVTRSGLIGKVTEMGERTVRVEIAPAVTVKMLKNAIEGLDGGDTAASKPADKDAKEAKEPADKKKK